MLRLAVDENFNNDILRGLLLAACSLEAEWEGQVRYLTVGASS
jgi:hypothetical protein